MNSRLQPAIIDQYQEERNQQLNRLRQVLEEKRRVSAAWLSGSLGRGQGDALSDVDLRVVIEDAWIGEVIANRRDFASQVGPVVLFLEAPQNAPEGGAYLMACYDAPTAPHIIDWQWLPRSLASIPPQSHVLLNRVKLSYTDQPPIMTTKPAVKEIISQPVHFISYFWMMLMIAAKYVYRSPWAEDIELLPYVTAPFIDAQKFLGDEPVDPSEFPSAHTPEVKIRILRDLADRIQPMMARIEEMGKEVPSAIIPGAYRYLEMVESAIRERKEPQ